MEEETDGNKRRSWPAPLINATVNNGWINKCPESVSAQPQNFIYSLETRIVGFYFLFLSIPHRYSGPSITV